MQAISLNPPGVTEVRRGGAQSEPAPTLPPVLRLGFRPFYLLAALFAAIAIPGWVASLLGHTVPGSQIGLPWHMHEMVFGFAPAVIIGFLYTAARNWTGLPTPRGSHLAALAGIWLAGRFAMLVAPAGIAAAADLAFLPLAAWPIWRVLQRAGNRRNYFLVGLLGMLTLANLTFHASRLGWVATDMMHSVQSAILLLVLIESTIAGRVLPGFTANAVPGCHPVVHERRDRMSMAIIALTAFGWAIGLPGPAEAGLAMAAGLTVMVRAAGYLPHRTLRNPLLWILHLSYLWIAVGLVLLALSCIGVASHSAAFHALGVGATGGLIIGMITRTALGHTARPLRAGVAETAMYLLLHAGALLRVLASLLDSASYQPLVMAAAACWSSAFVLYVLAYAGRLTSARLDGKDG